MIRFPESEKLVGELPSPLNDSNNGGQVFASKTRVSRCCGSFVIAWLLAFLYLPLGIWILVLSKRSSSQCDHPDLIPSPALESGAVEYEARRIRVALHDNPFTGDPRPESDQAWHGLLENNVIRVTAEDLQRVNLTSLELADGDYAAQLSFYHELHCIKRIRHWVYSDHYHSGDTEEESRENKAHVDHCIEMLRIKAICNADLSLTTFRWFSGDMLHATAEDLAEHQCVKEDTLMDWMRDRTVHLSRPGVLKTVG